MEDKARNVVISIGFIVILLILFLANILKQDQVISITERRKLEQFPEITLKKTIDGEVSKSIEKYAVDQFIVRDTFRGIKSFFSINILSQ